jgi:hypothetical protein
MYVYIYIIYIYIYNIIYIYAVPLSKLSHHNFRFISRVTVSPPNHLSAERIEEGSQDRHQGLTLERRISQPDFFPSSPIVHVKR